MRFVLCGTTFKCHCFVFQELRQLKDEKASLECRLAALENERKFDNIKCEQLENECMLLKSEISKNEQIQPVIEKLQVENLFRISIKSKNEVFVLELGRVHERENESYV